MNSNKQMIFKNGSVTYYTASLFFPIDIKKDIFTLYAFVRVADNFVDAISQQKEAFLAFKKETFRCLDGEITDNNIISDFVHLSQQKKFKKEWIVAFLEAMEQDLTKKVYKTLTELEGYMYGSAEVIGLFIAQILGLPTSSHKSAQLLGRSMQLINFIRDVQEDISMGRTYLPIEDQQRFKVSKLDRRDAGMPDLIRFELTRWRSLQKEAEKGFSYIPKRSLLPIKTASDMYKWTAQVIEKDPLIIFEKKVKPSKSRIITTYWKNVFGL